MLTSDGFESLSFQAPFAETPTVFSQVQTYNGSDFVVTRQTATTANGFSVAMQEEETLNGGFHFAEDLGWIALTTGRGSLGDTDYEVGTTPVIFDSGGERLTFDEAFAATPRVVTSLASYNGPDTAVLRWEGGNGSGLDIFVQEEQSLDPETDHVAEAVSYFAFEEDDTFTGSLLLE